MIDEYAPRTLLFVPALSGKKITKAMESTADAVIIDLEDSVSENEKTQARNEIRELAPTRTALVRINSQSSSHFESDVETVGALPWVAGVVLPKVRSALDVKHFRDVAGGEVYVLALIESAQGIVSADEIAASGVNRFAFGSVDYAADLGVPPTDQLYSYPRSRLVVASRAAGLPAPVDGPTVTLHNEDVLESDARLSAAYGMGGKFCIHPEQLLTVQAAFGSSTSDKRWARELLDAFERNGGGVFTFGGEMVDVPIITRARKILDDE